VGLGCKAPPRKDGVSYGSHPEALIPLTDKLIRKLALAEWDARIAGAGASGFVWALGEKNPLIFLS